MDEREKPTTWSRVVAWWHDPANQISILWTYMTLNSIADVLARVH